MGRCARGGLLCGRTGGVGFGDCPAVLSQTQVMVPGILLFVLTA